MTGLTYIVLPTGFFDDLRVRKIERRAGAGGVVCLLRLLAFALEHRPKGNLKGLSIEEVERIAGWEGEAGDLLAALITAQVVTYDGRTLRIVDWLGCRLEVARPPLSETERERQNWNEMRREVAPEIFRRDGYRCKYCGSTKRLTVDHVMPISRGGLHEKSNLVTACHACNSKKHAKTPDEWRPGTES